MPSIKTYIEEMGDELSYTDANEITSRAQALRMEGIDPQAAAQRAIDEQIDKLSESDDDSA